MLVNVVVVIGTGAGATEVMKVVVFFMVEYLSKIVVVDIVVEVQMLVQIERLDVKAGAACARTENATSR